MAEREEEVQVQLATKLPKSLHRQVKLHCIRVGCSLMDFVIAALREKLVRETGRKRGSGESG